MFVSGTHRRGCFVHWFEMGFMHLGFLFACGIGVRVFDELGSVLRESLASAPCSV